jgi:hypothetical protein
LESLFGLIGLDDAVADTAETTVGGFGNIDSFMSIMMIAIGVFALYSAVVGKGPAFKNSYPASMQEEANKMLQKFLWFIAPVTLASGILDFVFPGSMWPYLGGIIIIIPAIIIYVILFRRRFKEDLKRMR